MATRFYLPADGTLAPVVSPAFDSSWESSASAFRAIMETYKTGTALVNKAVATALNSPAGAVDIAFAQYISAALDGDQTISGAIKGVIRAAENHASADLRAQMVIRVVSNDGSTVRGTLIASDESALTSEFNTSFRNAKFPLAWTGSGQTPSSVNALDGDRIVIEVGYRKHENATTSRTGNLSLGDPAGSTDCAENETDTVANCPWVEFADTLSFSSGQARVSQVAPEVIILPTSQQALVSQVAPEVIILPTSQQARVSQVVLEVLWQPAPAPVRTRVVWIG